MTGTEKVIELFNTRKSEIDIELEKYLNIKKNENSTNKEISEQFKKIMKIIDELNNKIIDMISEENEKRDAVAEKYKTLEDFNPILLEIAEITGDIRSMIEEKSKITDYCFDKMEIRD